MKAWCRMIPAVLGAMVLAGVRPAAADEAQIIQRVQTALATTYYQGLLVTVRRVGSGREEEVAKAFFGPRGQQALEIITPSWRNGERFVVNREYAWLFYPDCGAVLRLPAAGQERRLVMAKEARLEGTDHLGDREVYVLKWESRIGTRRVWVDAERFVPLRREDRNVRDELLLSQTLQEVEFPANAPQARLRFALEPGLALYEDEAAFHQAVSLPHVQRGVDFRVRIPDYLPAGLAFRRATLRELPQILVVQLRFNDGKGKALSLFEYRVTQVLAPPERQFLAEAGGAGGGAKLSFARWRLGDLEFVLVGNLPAETLREVAKSIK